MVWRRVAITTALILGPAIVFLTVLRNWHGWSAWPFWFDDMAAAALLLAAAYFAMKDNDHMRGRPLSAALGLATGTLWASAYEGGYVQPIPETWSPLPIMTFAVTVAAFLVAATGLAASLASSKRPKLGTR